MGIKKAVVLRIKELCEQRKIAINSLATISGLTPSTIYSMLDPKRKDIGIVSLKKICDGLNITVGEFFNSDIFETLEQEIK